MKIFTYGEYIKCIHTFRLNAVMQLAEESVNYNINQQEEKCLHNRVVKNILQDKKEVTKFINQFLEPREEIKEELTRYTNSFITKKYKSKGADLIYKLKNQEVFFLIEHQCAIDNNMPYRMLNYCLDIMQEWSKNKKMRKNTSYPIIVPTVIYTGNKKWKFPKNFKEKQIGAYVLERYKIDLEYNFVDVNKFSNQYLLEKNTMFAYMMFLEKAQNKEELIKNLDIVIKSIKDKEKIKQIANIISDLSDNVLKEKIKKQLSEKMKHELALAS